MKWRKPDSGSCNVIYAVALKSATGDVFYNETIENVENRKICNLSAFANITDVQLTVSSKGISKVATAKISEVRIVSFSGISRGMMACFNIILLCLFILN